MENLAIRAVYKKGVFRPKAKLDLPENLEVEIVVKPSSREGIQPASLFGRFPELAAVSDADIRSVKKSWDKGLAKQARFLQQAK